MNPVIKLNLINLNKKAHYNNNNKKLTYKQQTKNY